MMTGLYETYVQPLSHNMLFAWHRMLLADAGYLQEIGQYRTQADAMQVVSGTMGKTIVHYEAPPSVRVHQEMEQFITWFNVTAPGGKEPLPALARAAKVHFYFVCIHPFEDGNGRLGRALVLKALCQNVRQPLLLALSYTIQKNKKAYYNALQTTTGQLRSAPGNLILHK